MKWSVGAKIGTGFFVSMLVVCVFGWLAYVNTGEMVRVSELRRNSFEILQHLQNVSSLLKDAETGQRGFVITGQDSYLSPYLDGIQHLPEEIGVLRRLLGAYPEQMQRLDTLEYYVKTKLTELRETIQLRRDQGLEATAKVVSTNQGKEAMDQANAVLSQIRRAQEAELDAYIRLSDASTRALFATLKYGIAAAAALMALLGYITTRNIAAPLGEVTLIADRIAHGDLAGELRAVRRSDEVGSLRNAFYRMNESLRLLAGRANQIAAGNLAGETAAKSDQDVLGHAFTKMTHNLRGIIQEISEAVNVLASSASEIFASTSQLASGAAETAAAVTQTTTTVEEVKQASRVSSDKAKFVAGTAQQASQVAQSGRRAVEEMIEGTNRTRQQMEAIAESIVRLSEQSQTIGEIIASVDDLAAQSNLLAVNASIEAAKAGEYGRGFSVVAQEVKSLADQSKQATTQVRAILTQIQKATNGAVAATEQGTKTVEAGVPNPRWPAIPSARSPRPSPSPRRPPPRSRPPATSSSSAWTRWPWPWKISSSPARRPWPAPSRRKPPRRACTISARN